MSHGAWISTTLQIKLQRQTHELDCPGEVVCLDGEAQEQSWSVGCHLVQWQINTQFHLTVQIVPYVLMFGQKLRVGIPDLPLDKL